jgi:putative membrane protein
MEKTSRTQLEVLTVEFDDLPKAKDMAETITHDATDRDTDANQSKIWLWLIITGFVSLLGVSALQLGLFFVESFKTTPILTSLLAVVTLVFFALLSYVLGREILAYRRIAMIENLPQQAATVLANADKASVNHLITQLHSRQTTGSFVSHCYQQYQATIQAHHTGQERLAIYRDKVATPLRERAKKCITQASLQAGGLSLISPNAFIHTSILLWRSAKLVRDIALVYGVRTGFAGNIKLLKMSLAHAIAQQTLDQLTDLALEHASSSISAHLGNKAIEGTATALLVRRLGNATIEELDVFARAKD